MKFVFELAFKIAIVTVVILLIQSRNPPCPAASVATAACPRRVEPSPSPTPTYSQSDTISIPSIPIPTIKTGYLMPIKISEDLIDGDVDGDVEYDRSNRTVTIDLRFVGRVEDFWGNCIANCPRENEEIKE